MGSYSKPCLHAHLLPEKDEYGYQQSEHGDDGRKDSEHGKITTRRHPFRDAVCKGKSGDIAETCDVYQDRTTKSEQMYLIERLFTYPASLG